MSNKIRAIFSTMLVFTMIASSMFSVFAQAKGNENKENNKNSNKRAVPKNININIDFNDLDKNFWGYKAIQELVKRGVINGYEDKSFKPNGKVTRSEFATMLSKALQLKASTGSQTFVDVKPTSWDYAAVEAAKTCLTGYKTSDGKLYFHGNKEAVREDMAVALVKALKLPVGTDNSALQEVFKDYNAISTNLVGYVNTAYKNNIMIGSNGKFAPQGVLTRAEAAALLNKALQKVEKVVIDENGEEKVVIDIVDQTYVKHTDAALLNLKYNDTSVTNFDPATLVYNVVLPVGTTTVPMIAGTVHDTGKATTTITQASALPGTGNVVVTAEDTTTKKTYIINFTVATAAKSTDATLSSLVYNLTTMPNFNPATLTYNVALPVGTTTVPVVAAVIHDTGKATVVVTQATALPGTANVVVTAEDLTTKKTYIINFTVTEAPKSTDATLSAISYNGTTMAAFAAGTLTYNVVLPVGTTTAPAISAMVTDTGKATTVITQATVLPGTANVVVTAEDMTTKKTYILNFTVAVAPKSTDATLSDLKFNGTTVTAFAAATLTYNVVLPLGTTIVPTVTAIVTDTGKATTVITQAAALPGTANVEVTAEDGTSKKIYSIFYTVAAQ